MSSNVSTVGARLREARAARGLSVDDVALSLKLSPRIISALEDDAYERLPSPTYVRGYLRSYGMLLGLPSQQLIDQFNSLPHAAQRADMTVPAPVREVTSSDAMVRLGTLLVVGIVLGLAVLWWSGKDGSSVRRRPPAVGPEAQVAEVSRPAPPPDVEPPADPAKPADPSVGGDKPATAAGPPGSVESRPTAAPIDPSAPRVRLVLRAYEDSWADVRDAAQRRLVYETMAAGRVVSVDGPAPLNVFLGNVEGVGVEVNGKPYDANRHKRGQVARFTLTSATGD